MARTHTVKRAQKDQGKCGKCGIEINKGDGYVWWPLGFRSRAKAKRCAKATCRPRPSELDSSKKSTILAAQEAFDDVIDNLTTSEEIEAAVTEVAEAVRAVAEEYREALDGWPNGNSNLEELADHYESQASDLEGVSISSFDVEPEEPEEPQQSDFEADENGEYPEYEEEYNEYVRQQAEYDNWQQLLEDARDEARDAVDGLDLQ